MENKKTVLIFSGGMDSCTLLYKLLSEGWEVFPLGVNYGQRHKKELICAREMCEELQLSYQIADMSGITHLINNSSQTSTDKPVPLGHYSEESMKLTVVPNRNMLMLAMAAGYAINIGADTVAYGAHFGDAAQYPDCREEFTIALEGALQLCDWTPIKLLRPFVNISKTDIAVMGNQLNVPFEKTWSCYQGQEVHCGACGTCVERREALYLAGVLDPTKYQITFEESMRIGQITLP